jgi:hypothetical protein
MTTMLMRGAFCGWGMISPEVLERQAKRSLFKPLKNWFRAYVGKK